MCDIMRNEVLRGMSTIIGICGVNFCTFWADRRQIAFLGNQIEVVREDYPKIFKVNPRVIVGGAGWFDKDEDILSALDDLQNLDMASVSIVKNAIVKYMNTHKDLLSKLESRNYLVGGKLHDKTFIIYGIHWNQLKSKVEVGEFKPRPPASNYGYTFALSQLTATAAPKVGENIMACLSSSRTHDELIPKVSYVIQTIASFDPSTNDKISELSVF